MHIQNEKAGIVRADILYGIEQNSREDWMMIEWHDMIKHASLQHDAFPNGQSCTLVYYPLVHKTKHLTSQKRILTHNKVLYTPMVRTLFTLIRRVGTFVSLTATRGSMYT
jgi:hypothetical protein